MAKSFSDVFGDTEHLPGINVRPPKAVLSDLAVTLTRRSKRKIYFEVDTNSLGNRLTHVLSAKVHELDNYTLQLLKISHEVLKLYPCSVSGLIVNKTHDVADEDELFDSLVASAKSKQFNDILDALMAQV